MTLNINGEPGDETRRNGDYVGLPHTTSEDGTGGPVEGKPVTFDGSTISEAAVDGGGTGDNIFGVLYTYQYFGDSSRDGPYIRTERNATVKTSGTVVVDLGDVSASPSEGDALGPNGEMLVLNQMQDNANHYEVLLR